MLSFLNKTDPGFSYQLEELKNAQSNEIVEAEIGQ